MRYISKSFTILYLISAILKRFLRLQIFKFFVNLLKMVYFQLDYVDLFGLDGINNTEFWDCSIGGGGCLKVAIQL